MFCDHVTVAVNDLAESLTELAAAGVETHHGGVHSNGMTHMALAAFRDGSYLEIVAPVSEQGRVSLWSDYSLPRYGGTAWTIAAADVGAELLRARTNGTNGKGPVIIRRNKPDGEIGSWELGYLGASQPGGTLPFLINDITHHDVRVPAAPQAASPFAGWKAVLLAVREQPAAAEHFRQLYGWGPAIVADGFTHFPGTPVYLHSPSTHLATFGESPSAGVLIPADESAAGSLSYADSSRIMEMDVRWLNVSPTRSWTQFRIGVEAL